MARTSQDIDAARAVYTRISSIYDALSDKGERRIRELGLSLLEARPGERILEVGFGTGSSMVALAEAVGESGHVCGIDISPGMTAVAEERIRSAKPVGKISLTLTAIPPIQFQNAVFDAGFMAFTLELFPDDTIPLVSARFAGRSGAAAGHQLCRWRWMTRNSVIVLRSGSMTGCTAISRTSSIAARSMSSDSQPTLGSPS